MFCLKFRHNGKDYLLHDGVCFIGAYSESEAHRVAQQNTGKALAVGGLEIVEYTYAHSLAEAVGGVPYKILDFSGGLGIVFHGVPLVSP